MKKYFKRSTQNVLKVLNVNKSESTSLERINIKNRVLFSFSFIPLLFFSINIKAQNPIALAQDFNLFTEGNFSVTSGDIEGAMAIGGNLSVLGNVQRTSNNATGGISYVTIGGTQYALIVGGGLSGVNGGNVFKVDGKGASTTDHYVRFNSFSGSTAAAGSGGIDVGNPVTNNLNRYVRINNTAQTPASVENTTQLVDFAAAFSAFRTNSTNISSCPNNVNPTVSGGQATLNLGANATNVWNVTGATLNTYSQINLTGNLPSATRPLVINVNAANAFDWYNVKFNIVGESDNFMEINRAPYIIWNFYNTTTLNIKQANLILGSILAPNANITNQSTGNITGQVIGKTFTKPQAGELHIAKFAGNVTCAATSFASLNTATSLCTSGVNSNIYSLTGSVSFTNAPSTGQLIISVRGGTSQVFNAPFSSPINYTINNLYADGAARNVTATFTENNVTKTTNFTAPTSVFDAAYTAWDKPKVIALGSNPGVISYSASNPLVINGPSIHAPSAGVRTFVLLGNLQLFNTGGPIGNYYSGFCTEFSQNAGSSSDYQVVPVETLSKQFAGVSGNASFNIPIGGIGKVRAGMLRYLYDNYFVKEYTQTTNTTLTAWTSSSAYSFALAQLEITHEVYTSNNSFNLLTGSSNNFYATSVSSLVTDAQAMLNAINTLNWSDDQWMNYNSTKWHLVGLESAASQDVVIAVPMMCSSGQNLNLGGTVWYDNIVNGLQDNTEPPVSTVVNLWLDANGDNLADSNVPVASTTTNYSGNYNFGGLLPGNYIVSVDIYSNIATITTSTSSNPNNNTDLDNNGITTGSWYSQYGSPVQQVRSNFITLSAGAEPTNDGDGSNGNLTLDFGIKGTASLGDRVWEDNNLDGLQTAGEPGIANVPVTLTYTINGVTSTLNTTTNASGIYGFAYLPPATYTVTFTTPAGYTATTPNVGGNTTNSSATDTLDSDVVNGVVSGIELRAGTSNNSIDAGFYKSVSIGDQIYHDINNNGIKDALEQGIASVSVNLYADANSDNIPDGAAIATTITNATGNYSFSNLAPGNYIVGAVIPANYTAAATTATSSNPNNDTNNDNNGITVTGGEVRTNFITITVGAEPTNDGDNSNGNLTLDIGLKASQYIGDYVWYDMNQNGIQDGDVLNGEYGVAGVKVELFNSSNVLLQTTNTNQSGFYNFVVAPGTYYVKFSNVPNEFTFTTQGAGSTSTDSDPNATTGITNTFTVTAGVNNTTIDAGLRSKAGVGNFVWVDANANGRQDAGEQGVSGIFVGLYNSSNVLVGASITDSTGYYFINTVPGTYYLKINLPSGYNLTTQNASGVPANLNSDANVLTGQTNNFTLVSSIDNDWDFGLVLKPNTQVVCGQVPLKTTDFNSNISIAKFVPSNLGTLTNVAINYSALTLNPIIGIENTGNGGTADLVTTSLATLALPNATSLVVNNGFTNPTVTLGTYDGLTDYRGTSGWNIVNNIKANSSSISNYTAASDFLWTSGNTNIALPFSTDNTANFNATGGNDAFLIRTMSSAGACVSYTYLPSSLGNFVWNDYNGNGLQDAGEQGIPGVTVRLKNGTTVLETAVTDANGLYLFQNPVAKYGSTNFVVEFVNPSGYSLSPVNLGSNDEIDSDPFPSSTAGLSSLFVSLPDGTNNLTVDAGFRPNGLNIGNKVWNDLNKDGLLNNGEIGIPNVPIYLFRDDNNDGTADASGVHLATTVTDANGIYSFSNLAPGGYRVALVEPASLIASTVPASGTTANNDVDNDNNASSSTNGRLSSSTFFITFGGEPTSDGDGNNGNLTIDFGLFNPYSLCLNSLLIDNFVTTSLIVPNISRPAPTTVNGTYTNSGSIGGYMNLNLAGGTLGNLPGGTTNFGGDASNGFFSVATAAGDSVVVTMQWDGDASPTLNPTGLNCQNLSPFQTIDFLFQDDRAASSIRTIELTLFSGPNNASKVTHNITAPIGGAKFMVSIPLANLVTVPGKSPVNLSCVGAIEIKAGMYNGPVNNNAWDLSIEQIVACSKVPFASLGDRVWKDDDADGIQDAGEVGVAGVAVVLLNSDGVVVGTSTTDAFGNYKFSNLLPGNYSVRVTPPANYTLSPKTQGGNTTLDSDFDPITYTTGTVTLTAGQNRTDIDAGLKFNQPQPASVGDRVWLDTNGDGVQDAGEPGVSNVLVTLYNNSGVAVASTYTDANGNYLFTDVAPGSYTVGVSLPPAMVFSPNTGATSVANNSDINPANGRTASFTVNAGDQIRYVDAGLKPQTTTNASVGDFVWNDLNKDGVQDAGEPGIAGVTVRLVNATTNTVVATTTTDANGNYVFNNVTPGNYLVEFVTPAGYTTTTKLGTNPATGATDNDADPATGRTATFTLGTGQRISTIDAGYWVTTPPGTGKIGDRVWYDANQNGVQDAGEQNVSGVTVILYNSGGTAIKQATTDQNGNYLFTDLAAGNYTVGFSNLPAGYTFTTQGLGTAATGSDANPATGRTATITLAAGQTNLDVDAGIISAQAGTASLGNRVWFDLNNNGLQDAGEIGVQGVTVALLDAAGNPIDKDPVTAGVQPTTTITNALGEYLFTGLGAGDYRVRFSTLPTGYTIVAKGAGTDRTIDSDGNPLAASVSTTDVVSLSANQERLDIDLGIYNATAPLGQLGDRVWFDANNNGIQDATETGVPGVSVALLNAAGATIATTVTDKDGLYKFVNLADATYSVQFSNLPSGFVFSVKDAGVNDAVDSDADVSTGKTGTYTIAGGNSNMTVDAGIYSTRAALGDYVWFDADSDGIQDATEAGISGVTVILYDASGVAVASTITDQSGKYFFNNLNPGTYTVGFSTIPGKLVFTAQDVVAAGDAADSDVNPATGRTGSITLVAGQVNTTVDAGLKPIPTASIGDFVWFDLDRDGIQDAGEPGVTGVIVTLYNAANQPIGSAVTDGDGYYQINNVPAGTGYYVRFSNQPDLTAPWTLQNAGGTGANNNSKVDATGTTGTFSVAEGQKITNIDAGLFKLVSLSGNVWHDVNAMGDNLVNNTGPLQTPPAAQIPAVLRAYLVNLSTGLVEKVVFVNSTNGVFVFGNVTPNTNYYIVVSSALGIVGFPPPAALLPSAWQHTGQKLGITPGSDGFNDGLLVVPVGTTDVINANFGIRLRGTDVVVG